jgi:hypothetical protein
MLRMAFSFLDDLEIIQTAIAGRKQTVFLFQSYLKPEMQY